MIRQNNDDLAFLTTYVDLSLPNHRARLFRLESGFQRDTEISKNRSLRRGKQFTKHEFHCLD